MKGTLPPIGYIAVNTVQDLIAQKDAIAVSVPGLNPKHGGLKSVSGLLRPVVGTR